MDRLFARTLLFAWALWLGGLVGVILAVTTIFAAAPDRTIAGDIATALFGRAERFALLLAAVSVISALGLLLRDKTRPRTVVLSLLITAALVITASTTLISPRIDAMRKARDTQNPTFKRLHGTSSTLYLTQVALLAGTGLLLPTALRRREVMAVSQTVSPPAESTAAL